MIRVCMKHRVNVFTQGLARKTVVDKPPPPLLLGTPLRGLEFLLPAPLPYILALEIKRAINDYFCAGIAAPACAASRCLRANSRHMPNTRNV